MADPEDTPADYIAQARSRIAQQYQQSTRLLAELDALTGPMQELEDATVTIPSLDDIDVAGGVNLDVTGDIVGQSRILVNGDIVTDAQYRLLIRARIARNGSHSTGPDFIASIGIIFPGAPVRLFDFEGMAIGFLIGVSLTADDISVLSGDILPRPMGVRINPRGFYDPNAYFGFADDPNAKGFSDDTIRGPGKLAEGF